MYMKMKKEFMIVAAFALMCFSVYLYPRGNKGRRNRNQGRRGQHHMARNRKPQRHNNHHMKRKRNQNRHQHRMGGSRSSNTNVSINNGGRRGGAFTGALVGTVVGSTIASNSKSGDTTNNYYDTPAK